MKRMIRATEQSMRHPSMPLSSHTRWWVATTYTQWEMKMIARQTMWAIATSLMEDLDHALDHREDWAAITVAPALPRLSWEGTSVYSHSFFLQLHARAELN